MSDTTLQGLKAICELYMRLPTRIDKKRITESGECKMISEWPLETVGTAMLCDNMAAKEHLMTIIRHRITGPLDEVG